MTGRVSETFLMTFDTLALPGNFMATTIHCLRGRQSLGLYAGWTRQHLQQLTTTRVGAPSTFSVSALIYPLSAEGQLRADTRAIAPFGS